MTNEKAIKVLDKMHKACTYLDDIDGIEALTMAIDALSVHTDTDLISRADAINAIYNEFKSAYCWNCDNQDSDDCEDCHRKNIMWSASKKTVKSVINDLPSVSTERVGEWIKKENDDDMTYWHECSVCGCKPLFNRWTHTETQSTYCPNCGAKMVKE